MRYSLFAILPMLLVTIGCSTEKNTFVNRSYHNITAKYNGYFNAREILSEEMKNYRASYADDYYSILPLEVYPNEEAAQQLYPQMDVAIEKSSNVISKHSMPNVEKVNRKTEEHCKWIDENWYVIARAQFIKRKYQECIQTCVFIRNSYPKEEIIYDALILQATAERESGDYGAAHNLLQLARIQLEQEQLAEDEKKENKKSARDSKKRSKRRRSSGRRSKRRSSSKSSDDEEGSGFPMRLMPELLVAEAQLEIYKKNYVEAVKKIDEALNVKMKRPRKARLAYVKAQLLAQMGRGADASESYTRCLKYGPGYAMEFHARINRAMSATGGTEALEKELKKMLRDEKNLEFQDQIYYALADIEIKRNDRAQAKEYLTKSARYSVKNDRQKGMSYMLLGDMSFEDKDYASAQKYYDSTTQSLPEDHERYDAVYSMAKGLEDLVFNLENLTLQDSLQNIAKMDEDERDKFLRKKVKEIQDAEREKKEREAALLLERQERLNQMQASTGGNGKWYFSNNKAREQGYQEFQKIWGQRPLEDHWRRTNKNSVGIVADDGQENDGQLSAAAVDSLTPEMLLADVPLSDSAMSASDRLIMKSLYNLGVIYKNELAETGMASDYWNQAIDRNIECDYRVMSAYQLFLLYKGQDQSQMDKYKEFIQTNYPTSDFALLVTNPEYYVQKEKDRRKELMKYEKLWYEFHKANANEQYVFTSVISRCDKVITESTDNPYLPKYYLLKAYAQGSAKFVSPVATRATLEQLVAKFPDTEEAAKARKILNGGTSAAKEEVIESPYKRNGKAEHYAMIFVDTKKYDVSQVMAQISDFNQNYFRQDNLKVNKILFDKETQMLIIKTLSNEEAAMDYYTTFRGAESSLGGLAQEKVFIIASSNFGDFFAAKNLEEYEDFHRVYELD